MCLRKSSASAGIFNSIDLVMSKYERPWSNCTALGVGNSSVYIRKHKALFNKIRKRNENVNLMGCLCHIVHNTAGKSIKAFCDDITEYFDIQELLVDIYFLFDCSSERKKMR